MSDDAERVYAFLIVLLLSAILVTLREIANKIDKGSQRVADTIKENRRGD